MYKRVRKARYSQRNHDLLTNKRRKTLYRLGDMLFKGEREEDIENVRSEITNSRHAVDDDSVVDSPIH
jgi:hypothetical protein